MERDETVHFFIDNSNLFIESQKFNAKKLGLVYEYDLRCRIDVGKLMTVLAEKRNMKQKAMLFCSEPPAVDTVWEKFRKKEIDVDVKRKNFMGKEKQVDNSLTAEVTELVVKNSNDVDRDMIIIIGGDRDYVAAIEKALKYKWRTVIAAYSACTASQIKDMAKHNPELLQIKYLDDIVYNEPSSPCLYLNTVWKANEKKKSTIPRERSFVAQFVNNIELNKAKELAESITSKTKNICLCFVNVNDASNIFFIIVPSMKRGNYKFTRFWIEYKKTIVELCRNTDETFKQLILVINYYNKTKENTLNLELTNQFELLSVNDSFGVDEDDKDLIYDSASSEKDDDSEEDIDDEEDDELVQPDRKQDQQKYSSPCDFGFLCRLGSNCKYKHEEIEKEFFKKNGGKGCKNYKGTICQKFKNKVCSNMKKTHLCKEAHGDEDARCYRCDSKGKVMGHTRENCANENKITSNLTARENNKLERCIYSFTCLDGIKCAKIHTEDEKQFFESNNGKGSPGYKSKPCWYKSCKHKKHSLLCSYAHNEKEARCYSCKKEGHYVGTVECPKRSR